MRKLPLNIAMSVYSVILLPLIYVVNSKDSVIDSFNKAHCYTKIWAIIVSAAIVISALSCIIWQYHIKGNEDIKSDLINNSKDVSVSMLPTYLGYVFVALSIQSLLCFLTVFTILSVLLYCVRFYYFNPIFLLFGYKFYEVELTSGIKIIVISKKEITARDEQTPSFLHLMRINDLVLFDTEK